MNEVWMFMTILLIGVLIGITGTLERVEKHTPTYNNTINNNN